MFKSLPHIILQPGELYFADTPTHISTLIGSCVTVTFFHHQLKLGAMNHAMLTQQNCDDLNLRQCTLLGGQGADPKAFRYVECSLLYLIQKFKEYGSDKIRMQDIEVKLFGGADMLKSGQSIFSVGEKNVEKTMEILKFHRLHVMASDVRGEQGRQLYFNTVTGEVRLRRVKKKWRLS